MSSGSNMDAAGYERLAEAATKLEHDRKLPGNRIIYLALPLDALTLPVIDAARRVMFVATGANKSHIVRPLLAGHGDPSWPATLVQRAGSVEWHVDEAAARSTART